MSQAPHSHDDHEGPIKTPKQLIVAVVLAFLVPILIIVLLVNYVSSENKSSAGSEALGPEATVHRIRPVATVEVKAAVAPGSRTGEEVFKAQCTSCHTAGALGAPKFGDAGAWAPRIARGLESLWASALKGKNSMPPQGGGEFADVEIKRAVVYMANAGGAKFEVPPMAAAAASEVTVPVVAAAPPVGAAASVVTALPVAAPVATAGTVPALYTATCMACHGTGVLGAPKLGDKAAWAPRLAAGVDGLTASAIKGKNAMPARGGSGATDAEIKAVVAYMVGQAK